MNFDEFKTMELTGWDDRAKAYSEVSELITKQTLPRLLDGASIKAGARVLELACGPGYGSALARGIGAEVTGSDFAANMVAEASSNYPEVSFQVEDAESLTFSEETFDRVICSFGVLHFAYPEKAFEEVHRVLKPNGVFAFSVWAEVHKVPFFGALLKVVGEKGSLDVSLPNAPQIDKFSRKSDAESVLVNKGFKSIKYEEIENYVEVNNPKMIIDMYRATVRSRALLDAQDPTIAKDIEDGLTKEFSHYKSGDNLKIPMPFVVIAATKG